MWSWWTASNWTHTFTLAVHVTLNKYWSYIEFYLILLLCKILYICTTYYSKLESGRINIHISVGLFVRRSSEGSSANSQSVCFCCAAVQTAIMKEAVPTGSQFMSAVMLYRQSLWNKLYQQAVSLCLLWCFTDSHCEANYTNRQSICVYNSALETAILKQTSHHAVNLFCLCCCTDSCFVRLGL